MKLQDIPPGAHFVVATMGMRGHFACEMWINNEIKELEPFPEPWQSDPGTFTTREKAVERAKQLANELKLPYIE